MLITKINSKDTVLTYHKFLNIIIIINILSSLSGSIVIIIILSWSTNKGKTRDPYSILQNFSTEMEDLVHLAKTRFRKSAKTLRDIHRKIMLARVKEGSGA